MTFVVAGRHGRSAPIEVVGLGNRSTAPRRCRRSWSSHTPPPGCRDIDRVGIRWVGSHRHDAPAVRGGRPCRAGPGPRAVHCVRLSGRLLDRTVRSLERLQPQPAGHERPWGRRGLLSASIDWRELEIGGAHGARGTKNIGSTLPIIKENSKEDTDIRALWGTESGHKIFSSV